MMISRLAAKIGIGPRPKPPSATETKAAQKEQATVDRFTGRFSELRSELNALDGSGFDQESLRGRVEIDDQKNARTASLSEGRSQVSIHNHSPNGYGGIHAEEFHLDPNTGVLTVLQGPVDKMNSHIDVTADNGHRKLQINTNSGRLISDQQAPGGLHIHDKILATLTYDGALIADEHR